MANWRVRGFVPDSDEEEDSQDSFSIGARDPTLDEPAPPDHGQKSSAGAKAVSVTGRNDEVEDVDHGSQPVHGVSKALQVRVYQKNRPEPGKPSFNSTIWSPHHDLSSDDELDELQNPRYDHEPISTASPYKSSAEKRTATKEKNSELHLNGPQEVIPLTNAAERCGYPSEEDDNTLEGSQLVLEQPRADAGSQPADTRPASRASSSSLSDLSSQQIGEILSQQPQRTGTPSQLLATGAATDVSALQPANSNVELEAPRNRSNRTFRRRKAIQLHPYLIEADKHRKIFHDHGMQAVRFAQQESQAPEEEDSQAQAFASSQQSRSSSVHSEDLGYTRVNADADAESDVDKLPDINDLLNGQDAQFLSRGHKRQRLERPRFKYPSSLRKRSDAAGTKLQSPINSASIDSEGEMQKPPSPPISVASSSDSDHIVAPVPGRRPLPHISHSLPTPATSSSHKTDIDIDIFDKESSSNGEASNPEDDQTSDSSGEPVSSEHDPYQRVKHRMRGVLPASWLKLDLQAQSTKSTARRPRLSSPSPEKRNALKGIARPVARAAGTRRGFPPEKAVPFVISDDEASVENDDDNEITLQEIAPQGKEGDVELLHDHANDVDASRWGEAEEVPEFDAMLPPSTRPFRRRKSRKRQTRISDFDPDIPLGATVHTNRQNVSDSNARHARQAVSKSTARRPKFRPPKLSILDFAAESNPSVKQPQPRFISVASRTTRRRRDKGKHSPSSKVLKLSTHLDTLQANEQLERWRHGRIKPAVDQKRQGNQCRQPLLPISDNAPYSSAFRHSTNSLKLIQPENRPQSKTDKLARPIQSTLDQVLLRDGNAQTQEANLDHPSYKSTRDAGSTKNHDMVRGLLQSSVRNASSARPAMLEVLQEDEDLHNPKRAFARHLQSAMRNQRVPQAAESMWNRATKWPISKVSEGTGAVGKPTALQSNPKTPTKARKPRKRLPRRLDLSVTWQNDIDISASSSPEPIVTAEQSVREIGLPSAPALKPAQSLAGLGPYGTTYTLSFGVDAFPVGTCFHESTFLGSGRLRKSLDVQNSTFAHRRSELVFTMSGSVHRWGAWNEDVSSDMTSLCAQSLETGNHQSVAAKLGVQTELIQNCASHFANHLHFFDPVDRVAYIGKSVDILGMILQSSVSLGIQVSQNDAVTLQTRRIKAQLKMHCTIFAHQLNQLAHSSSMSEIVKTSAQDILSRAHASLCEDVWASTGDIEAFIGKYQAGRVAQLIIEGEQIVEAFVILHHITLRNNQLVSAYARSLSDYISSQLGDRSNCVPVLENAWRTIFSLQPLLDIDVDGVLKHRGSSSPNIDSWSAIKRLISPVLQSYLSNSTTQAVSFNAYCRAIFGRCLDLINTWRWYKCDTIIGVLFDFFSKGDLHNLTHEECHGSPVFLENLREELSLTTMADDRCFHIFLKIIGVGIRHLRQVSPEKKVRDVVWRLMPNHGRSYPKEESVRQEDLDALRNHHDLLCALYWAAPADIRPRLTTLRNLVHVESSHRQATHINIRTWENLLRYQLSTTEPTTSLPAFVDWFNELLTQILRQHTQARFEAEDQVRSAQHLQGVHISDHVLQATVSKNQRKIEALLSDVLASLDRAVNAAQTRSAIDLLLSPVLTTVFGILNVKQSHTSAPVIDALKPILSYTRRLMQWIVGDVDHSTDEDSQDYGDWSALVPDHMDTDSRPLEVSPLSNLHGALHQLLSNCFGADSPPLEELLCTLVDTWVAVSHVMVRSGDKSWSDYIGYYHSHSWASLRNTDQKRKYTAYYLARLLQSEPGIYSDEKAFFLRFFMESLVERESLLKFQHTLTASLLNLNLSDPLMANLPFYVQSSDRTYNVTAREFSERRLSVISSILANMRQTMDAPSAHATETMERRQQYRELLVHMMHKMKENYRELGQTSIACSAYVDFVHHVVGFLQQYTTGICSVDRFFTDDASFPLPATDPNYVVSRLKNYELRIHEPRAQKELVTFIQSIAERAVVDNQQAYLVGQIQRAISPALEKGKTSLTLRGFMVAAVLPAYAECTFRSACGWILCRPFLEALQHDFDDLNLRLDGCSTSSVEAVSAVLSSYLQAMQNSMLDLCVQPSLLNQASTLKIIRAYFDTASALMPTLDYLHRLEAPVKDCIRCVADLTTFAETILQAISSSAATAELLYLQRLDAFTVTASFQGIREFATVELKQALDQNWSCVEGVYFVSRGSGKKEVSVDVGLIEEERQELKKSLEGFAGDVKFFDGRVGRCFHKEETTDAWNGIKAEEEDLLLF